MKSILASLAKFRDGLGERVTLRFQVSSNVLFLESIRFRLTLVFMFFLVIVAGVGLFSIHRLSDFHRVSSEISDRWLQSTRVLGDLNNVISDFRAAEGEVLISNNAHERNAAKQQIREMDAIISQSQNDYKSIRHDPQEMNIYKTFSREWESYRAITENLIALADGNQGSAAKQIYYTKSRQAYNQANKSLLLLTDTNIAGATAAVAHQSEAYRQAFALIILVILVAIALALLGIAYLVMLVSKPILTLVGRMNQISQNELTVNIPGTERRDEIGEMARAVVRFRDNTRELDNSKSILVQQAIKLQHNLDAERKMAALQRSFIATVSHEFRTPLNLIDAHAQRLMRMKESLTSDILLERCGRMRTAVSRMTDLIHRLLDYSEILGDGESFQLQRVGFSIVAMLKEACDTYCETAASTQINIHFDTIDTPIFFGDEQLLFQAVSNLLDNAIKYSPTGSPITVIVTNDGNAFQLSIFDKGRGIPESNLNQIFNRFVRGENANGILGAGVGLSFVKWVIDMHGGQLTVHSEVGRGSEFKCSLPVLCAPPAI